MGNENYFQTSNDSPKNNTNHKKRIHKNNSNLYNNFTDQENLLDFLIKVENGILLPNLNLSNSISLNNINVPSKNLKNEINYLQSINDFTDIRLERNKEFDFNNDTHNKTKYIEIINNILNNNKNKNNNTKQKNYGNNNNRNYNNIKENFDSSIYNNRKEKIDSFDYQFNNKIYQERNNNNLSTIETSESKKNYEFNTARNTKINNIGNFEDNEDDINNAIKNLKIFKIILNQFVLKNI